MRLSFVPDAEQRTWRCVSRNKHQKRQRRIQIQNQIEALLEECQIKLSNVITGKSQLEIDGFIGGGLAHGTSLARPAIFVQPLCPVISPPSDRALPAVAKRAPEVTFLLTYLRKAFY